MPIQPIDLQTLFAHMNDVGKAQAERQEASHLQQSAQGNQLVKKTDEQDHSVNANPELDEQEGVKNESESGARKRKGEKRDGETQEKKTIVYRDPDLGANIDLQG
jgi:uncharacterized membrane protein YdbT with pleckstrin-like domain